MEGYDIVMNAAKTEVVLPALHAAIRTGTHYCDVAHGAAIEQALQHAAEAEAAETESAETESTETEAAESEEAAPAEAEGGSLLRAPSVTVSTPCRVSG